MSRSTNAESGWLVYPQLLWPVGAESSFGFWTKKSWTKCWLCQNHWFWNGSTFCLVAEHLMTNTFSKLMQRPEWVSFNSKSTISRQKNANISTWNPQKKNFGKELLELDYAKIGLPKRTKILCFWIEGSFTNYV